MSDPISHSTLARYEPPAFSARISRYAPIYRLPLCMRPTPIEAFPLSSVAPNSTQTFHIKRDDQTGGPTSGNKIRKLEFILAKALAEGATTIITAGGIQSNHARATAVAARRLGLKVHVFLRTKYAEGSRKVVDGNVLIHKLLGVQIHLIRPLGYEQGLKARMQILAKDLEEKGETPYLIGIGGSDEVGMWGYIEGFSELLEQGLANDFSDVVVAVGSGGTASGLAIGNYLAGQVVKIHAVSVCDSAEYFYGHLNDMLKEVGLDGEVEARDILNIIENKGLGYAKNTDDELKFCLDVSMTTGIMLDPVYTLKGVLGMLRECQTEGGSFGKDARILFIHTGGIFGLFDRRMEPFLDHSLASIWYS